MEEKKLLKKKQKAFGNDPAYISACTDLAEYYLSEDKFKKAIQEYEIISNLYKSDNKLILFAQANRGIGEAYMGLHEFENAYKHFKIYLNVSIQENDILEQQRALAQLGHMYLTWYLEIVSEDHKKHLIQAYQYFMKSLKKCENLPENIEKQDMLARLFANLGLVKENLGEYGTSLNLYEKSIKICVKHELYEQMYRGRMAMASLFDKQEKYQETIKQFNLAIEIAKKLSTKRVELVCAALLAKSDTLIKIADFTGAKTYLRKAYKFKTPNFGDRKLIERNLRVVAALCKLEDDIILTTDKKELKELYEKMGDGACDLKNFSKAIEYYHKMLKTAEMIGSSDKELQQCYYSLGETYKDNGQYQEAEVYFEKEYELCKNNLKDSLNTLCKIVDLKEQAKSDVEEIKTVYNRALDNCKKKSNLKEEKIILIRYLNFLRRNLCHGDAYNCAQRLNEINEFLGDDEQSSSSSDNESEDSGKVHVGADIVLSDISDMSEDSDYEVTEPSAAQPATRRRNQPKVKFKKNLNGEWPLHVAAIKGDMKMMEYWLNVGHPVNVRDNAGWLPLHEAALHGHLDIVRLLLDHKAAINDRGGAECNGMTPLHDAAGNGHLEVVKLMLDRGASALVKSDDGCTPLTELKKWYNRSEGLSVEQQTLYEELAERLSGTLDRAGQSDLVVTKSRSPEKRTASRGSPSKVGSLRRNASFYDVDDEEEEQEETPDTNEFYTQPSLEEERNASLEYQSVMQNLRHKNYQTEKQPSPVKSQSDNKRSAYVADVDFVDENDWLEEDVRPTKNKRRKTDESLKLTTRSRSFGQDSSNRSPRISTRTEDFERNDLDWGEIQTTPNIRRISDESNTSSSGSNKSKRKTQATLLDAGFSKKRNSSSPGIRPAWRRHTSSDGLVQARIPSFSQISTSSVEADSTTLPQSQIDHTSNVLDPTLFVDVQIEGRLFRVPVLFSQIQSKTIKWLASEAAHRYASKEYMKPTLELETVSGAVLADDDLLSLLFPMGSTQAEKVIAKVTEWSLPPLIDRYMDTCHHMSLDVDTDLCQLIETLSVNLDLENRGILGTHLSPLLKAINHQKNLTEINLSGNFLNTSCINMLCTSLVTLPNLRVLNLSCTDLQTSHLSLLTNTITNHTSVFSNLSVLNLSHNLQLSQGCLKDLAAITRVINLKTLDLKEVKLNGLAAFCDSICLKTVERLDVSSNELEVRDVRRILSWTDRSVLKELNLSNNAISQGLGPLFEVLDGQKEIVLEKVGLSRCNVTDSELFELLGLAPNLTSLNLSYNKDLTSISLRRLLGRSNLQYLNLICCENIWKYFDPCEEGWYVDFRGNTGETILKLSGGRREYLDCITNLFLQKYPSCNVTRSDNFLAIALTTT
ncbi:tonsoku-like protein isoform X2 [Sitophilus oryzae]|uniref:Tonsoku-like protein isoform X2 n=1 Tax=Sitophilus oryzae TaxID=7048 RepID=A0A6J2XDB7_SITOR|nr:tonsoku-like protein isoform X2 [Sitophilus oryzae]